MERKESDKEDLMVEATALVERIEYEHNGSTDFAEVHSLMTAGYRRDGSFSIYFDQEHFYQFDDAGLLRRAWSKGFLYRTQGDTLAELDRVRTGEKTILQRRDLSPSELASFAVEMRQRLSSLLSAQEKDLLRVRRVVSPNSDLKVRIPKTLRQILNHDSYFLSKPIARGNRKR